MSLEWFKLFKRDARILDSPLLSMESRGLLITNALRYFEGGDLLKMTEVEEMAFSILKRSIDDSVAEYEHRVKVNSENGAKGGRPKAKKPIGFLETDRDRRELRREENKEENKEERRGKDNIDSLALLRQRLYG